MSLRYFSGNQACGLFVADVNDVMLLFNDVEGWEHGGQWNVTRIHCFWRVQWSWLIVLLTNITIFKVICWCRFSYRRSKLRRWRLDGHLYGL